MIDLLIINNCPAFYKINLYNKIAEHKNIFVIFLGLSNQVVSGNAFKEKINFPYILINDIQVENRSYIKTLFNILKIIYKKKPKKIIYGGYIEPELLLLSFLSSKKNNILQTETSLETKLSGWRYWLKVLLLKRYKTAIASGKLHKKMLRKMKFSGDIHISKGVGIIDYQHKIQKEKNKKNSNRFLYVGRLIDIKNVVSLVNVFNQEKLQLTIVGNGPLFSQLKNIAKDNITLLGFIDNENIGEIYQNHDVFILPSLVEPWGLVLEEALFYGLPLAVSEKVGSRYELVEEKQTGVLFDATDEESIKSAIHQICKDYDIYNENVLFFNFNEKDGHQINTYLKLC